MPQVAIIEDDRLLAQTVKPLLEAEGYGVEAYAATGDALHGIRLKHFNLLLLDVGHSGAGDGLDLCRAVRADETIHDLPIIIVSGRAAVEDRIAGLQAGADDYVVKPFSARELVARIRAVGNRSALVRTEATAPYRDRTLEFTPSAPRLFVGRHEIPISRGEADVLALLITESPGFVSAEEIARRLSTAAHPLQRTTIEARLKSLRKKIGRQRIESRVGFGYVFTPDHG